jgi:hypothetical protein
MRTLLLAGFLATLLVAQRDRVKPFPPEVVPPQVTESVDALRIDPAHYRLELENEQIRVLRLTLKADEAVPMHDANDALAVCAKECHLRLTYPDKRIQDIHIEAGRTRWLFGNTRSEKNLSIQPLEMLLIEPKVKPPPH